MQLDFQLRSEFEEFFQGLDLESCRGGPNCDTLVSLPRFVSDRMTWDVDSQFLLGPAFLVSPVLEAVSMEASDDPTCEARD